MLKNGQSMRLPLIVVLVLLSGMGAMIAGQQYLFLQTERKLLPARRALEESFLSAIKAAGGESNPEIAQLLARRKASIEGSYSGEADMIHQLEIRALADTIIWFVVMLLAGVVLPLYWRKQHKSGVSPPVSSA